MTASHLDAGIAIYLTGSDAVDKRIFDIRRSVVPPVLQRCLVLVCTLTTAIDAVADETVCDVDSGILIDVTVLTAAIDSSRDAICS